MNEVIVLDSSSDLQDPNSHITSEEEQNRTPSGNYKLQLEDTKLRLQRLINSNSLLNQTTITKSQNNLNELELVDDDDSKGQAEDNFKSHTGLSQPLENSSLTAIPRIKDKKEKKGRIKHPAAAIKVKSDALKEICIRLPKKYASLSLPGLPHVALNEFDTNLVMWHRMHDSSLYSFALKVVDLEEIYHQIESKQYVRVIFGEDLIQFPNRHLYVVNVKKYLTKLQSVENRHFKHKLALGQTLTPERLNRPTWNDLENELYLQAMQWQVHLQFLNDASDLPTYLVELTKCIAWEPHAQRHLHSMGMMGSQGARTGKTMDDTWRQMLLAIPRVSDATATLIVRAYPTMSALRRAFQLRGPEALANLAAIGNGNNNSAARCLGPSLSRKLYILFMTNEPNKLFNI